MTEGAAVPLVERVAGRALVAAARRWPAGVRDEVAREWAAELHVLGREAGVPGAVRAWRQARFAGSLAWARPGAPRAAAGAAPGLESAVIRAAALFGAALLAGLVSMVVIEPLRYAADGTHPTGVAAVALTVLAYAARVVPAAWLGFALAGRVRRAAAGRPAGVLTAAVLPAVPLAAGAVADDAVVRGIIVSGLGVRPALVGLACGIAVLVPVAVAVATLAGRGRHRLAGAAAALGTPVVALAGTAAAVLWVGAGPPGRDRGWWWLPALAGVVAPPEYRSPATPDRAVIADVVPLIAGTLVMIAVVWLAYAARLALPARAGAVEAVPAPAYPASASALTRSGWWPRLALAGGVFAVVAWAVVLTYLTPNVGIPTPWPAEAPDLVAGWRDWNTHEGRLWMHELRLFAILSAALCLLLAGAFRGAPLLPAIGGTAVLLAVDTAVAGAGLASLRALPSVVVAGLAVGAAAWWAALRLGERDRRGDDHRRRLVAGVTLFTVVVAPGIHLHRIVPVPGVQTPPSVLLVAVGLPAVLLALAGLGMAGTAARPFGRGAAYGLPIGLGGAALAGGLLLWRDGVPQIAGFWAIALTGPLVTLTVVVIRGGLPAGQLTGLRSVTVLVALASMPVAVVVGFLSILVSMFSADKVLAPIGYHLGFDGLPYVPGAVVVGIVASLLLTARLKGQPARPAFDTVTPPPGPAASGPAASGPAASGPAAVGVATPQ